MMNLWFIFISFINLISFQHSSNHCSDFTPNHAYNNDTNNVVFNLTINERIEYVPLGSNPTTQMLGDYAFTRTTVNCTNPDGCSYHCNGYLSCYEAIINCESITGCNIICSGNEACHLLVINAKNQNANQTSTTSINIVCNGTGVCQNVSIDVIDIQSAHIHCMDDSSCRFLRASFEDMSLEIHQNASVTCYQPHACNDMNIYIDPLTQINVNMDQYSANVRIHDQTGYVSDDDFVTALQCGYIEYIQYEYGTSQSIESIVRSQYSNNTLPCENVNFLCNNTGPSASCNLVYQFLDKTIIEQSKQSNPSYNCTNIALTDIAQLVCNGNCLESPTKAPTSSNSPTFVPSNIPTFTPSSRTPTKSPSFLPSDIPTLSPIMQTTQAPTPILTDFPSKLPTYLPTALPSVSPVYFPSQSPTFNPTDLPLIAPVISPTASPTLPKVRFNAKINIIYGLSNLTGSNYEDILFYPSTNAIEIMEDIIELNYFHQTQNSKYEEFSVEIKKMNQIDYTDNAQFISKNLNREKILYIKSELLFLYRSRQYFLTQSNNPQFYASTTLSFRKYFNNSNVNFTVANSSNLRLIDLRIEPIDEETIFWITTGVLFTAVLMIIFGTTCSRMYKKQLLLSVDNANWVSLLLLFLSVVDVATNLYLVYNIYYGNTNSVIFLCGMMMATFIGFRLLLNLIWGLVINKQLTNNVYAKQWLSKYKLLFLLLIVISGGNYYPILYVVSSNVFGLRFTRSGISLLEINQFYLKNNNTLWTIMFIDCLPQLIAINIIFAYQGLILSILLALTSTTLFFVIYTVFLIINRIERKKGDHKPNAFYYIAVTLKLKSLKASQQRHIQRKYGLKSALKKQFMTLYPKDTLEIGSISIRKKSFVIRVIHQLNKEDINEHMDSLYASNSSNIHNIIFNHFDALDPEMFEIEYYKHYPKQEKSYSMNKINSVNRINSVKRINSTNRTNSTNRINSTNTNTVKRGTLSYDKSDGESTASDTDDDDNDNDDEKELIERKQQFRRAITIVQQEQKRNSNDPNNLLFVLQSHDINYNVIDDVLKYGKQTGMLGQKCESDIDNSDDSGVFSDNTIAMQMEMAHLKNNNNRGYRE